MSTRASSEISWDASARTDSKPVVRLGLWMICAVMGVFLVWGSLLPLSSAIITVGLITSSGKNKLIQHRIGGQVAAILAREGDWLAEGQPVIELVPTEARAEQSKLDARFASLRALRDRLDAERRGGIEVMRRPTKALKSAALRGTANPSSTPVKLRGGDGEALSLNANATSLPELFVPASLDLHKPPSELHDSQRDAYDSGRALLSKEVDTLKKKAATLAKQRDGLRAREASQKQLLALTKSEIEKLRPLVDKGYVARNRLGERQKTVLEMEGALASLVLDIAGIENQMGEVELQIEKARITTSDAAAREYAKIVAEIAEIEEQRSAARDAVRGLVVRAPVSGKLTGMRVHTVGGVIGGGDLIGEVVPDGASLLAEARVAPTDIDFVRVGQNADVAITAFNRRLDDTINGTVTYIAADSEKDENTGEQFFTVRLSLDDEGIANKRLGDIQAGMQAEVYINTGSRTFLTYLTKPLLDSFRRAFRER